MRFFVYDIVWQETIGLPDEAYIDLPASFVEAEDLEEDTWNDAVNDQLQRQFGHRAAEFQLAGEEA